jgi:hypothetical protein
MRTEASALGGDSMRVTSDRTKSGKRRLWIGWIVSALPALLLLSSGVNVARSASFVLEGFSHLGYGQKLMFGIGVTEFLCAALYLIPRTAFLGALLTTAYLGGATASHVRVGDPFIGPVLVGVVVWIGLILRDRRLSTYILDALRPTRK